jgi:hypothetical protein
MTDETGNKGVQVLEVYKVLTGYKKKSLAYLSHTQDN